jgi:hypothetical protein
MDSFNLIMGNLKILFFVSFGLMPVVKIVALNYGSPLQLTHPQPHAHTHTHTHTRTQTHVHNTNSLTHTCTYPHTHVQTNSHKLNENTDRTQITINSKFLGRIKKEVP